MASLSEMLQYAELQNQRQNATSTSGRVADLAASAITGFAEGREKFKTEQRAGLDTALKFIEIQEKMQRLEMEQEQQRMNTNIAKGLGLVPLDQQETDRARMGAFDAVGEAKVGGTDHTRAGKLGSIYKAFSPENYDTSYSFTPKNGIAVSLKPKKAGSGASAAREDVRRQRIFTLATKLATMETADLLKGQGRDPNLYPRINPSQDVVKKYIPIAEEYYAGNKGEFGKLLKKRRQEYDPLGGDGEGDGALNLNLDDEEDQ